MWSARDGEEVVCWGACPPPSCGWWGQSELPHPSSPAHLQCEDSLFSSSGGETGCGLPAVLEEGLDLEVLTS